MIGDRFALDLKRVLLHHDESILLLHLLPLWILRRYRLSEPVAYLHELLVATACIVSEVLSLFNDNTAPDVSCADACLSDRRLSKRSLVE